MSEGIFICILCTRLIAEMSAFMTMKEIALSEYKFQKKLDITYMSKVRDYEEYASVYMDRHARDYYNNGAGDMQTLQDNERVFKRFRIRPRLMRNVSQRNMNLTVFGHPVGIPFGASPVALQKMVHPDGEIGTVRAVSSFGGITILSLLSTTPMEELQFQTLPGSVYWLQIFITKDREHTKELIHKAYIAGFKAIVITVDTSVNGLFDGNMVHNLTLPAHLRLPNLSEREQSEIQGDSLRSNFEKLILDPSLSWDDIYWIRTFTSLPIIVKGILTAEDAILAVEHGASGILVSNHGGRQLDGVPATLDVLPEIVRAVKDKAEVFLDGGVRSGTDVFKALALGAKTVFFGRPVVWGLVHSGEKGVKNVMNIVRKELDNAMALAGAPELKDIEKSHVVREDFYTCHI